MRWKVEVARWFAGMLLSGVLLAGCGVGSNDGKIVFTSSRDGDFEIFVMDADGTGLQQLTYNVAGEFDPSWSPDGSKIVFTSNRRGRSEIFVMDADGTGVQQLTYNEYLQNLEYVQTYVDGSPSWSPDGSKIVFTSNRNGDFEIFVMDADGTGVQQLTDRYGDHYSDALPSWSPDGGEIAFGSMRDGRRMEIFVMDADGTGARRLTDIQESSCAAWSPDGSKIAFCSYDFYGNDPLVEGDFEIFVMNADGTEVQQLTDTEYDDRNPSWSPDGRKIAFARGPARPWGELSESEYWMRQAAFEIFVMDADGRNVVSLNQKGTRLDWGG